MEVFEYIIIGYLILSFLVSAYLRRDQKDEFKLNLSKGILFANCLATLLFFFLFYVINNYQKYLLIYLLITLLIQVVAVFLSLKKIKNEK